MARIEVLRGTREDTIRLLTKEMVDNLRRRQEEAALIRVLSTYLSLFLVSRVHLELIILCSVFFFPELQR